MRAHPVRTATLLALVGALAVGGAVLVTGWHPSSEQTLLEPDHREVVAVGERIYDSQCASCHGEDLQGEPDWQSPDEEGHLPAPPHDETGHTWHHADEVLFNVTKNGLAAYAGPNYRTRMPKFGGVLTDEEIVAVLSYIKSRWSREVRKRHDALNAATEDR
ncbi:c-type cytochrome [Aurantimonas aggregata]|uniref:C-type cytochrome n=1 Tax=Aurantimonas aggregata TaxID=2047720 RepID=A0A6L9MP41_9HYPH|nr:cytochrome c [Aurantimonas aggregata]NDV89326.1 c-type cytochrome [Aurantimonas aggregata]